MCEVCENKSKMKRTLKEYKNNHIDNENININVNFVKTFTNPRVL